jgi:CBS domain-containing protein
MDYLRKFLLVFFLLFFLSLASSSPPQLPTSVYGRVLSSDGEPVLSQEVVVTWKGSDGIVRSLETYTIGGSKNSGLAGHYYFLNGEISLLEGMLIRIKSGNVFVEAEGNPGVLVEADDIVLEKQGFIKDLYEGVSSLFSGSGGDEYSNEGDSFGDEVGSSGHLESSGDELATSSFVSDDEFVTNHVSWGGEIGGEDLKKGSSNITSSEGENGSYIGDLGSPLIGEGVVRLDGGNTSLEKGSERKSGMNINLDSVIMVYASASYTVYDKFIFSIILLGVVVFLVLFILFVLFFLKKVGDFFLNKNKRSLKIDIKGVDSLHLYKFMSKEIFLLSPEDSVLEAVNLFSANNVNLLPVVSGKKMLGVVSKKDILSKIDSSKDVSLEKMKIRDIVRKNYVSVLPGTRMADLYDLMLEKCVDEIVVKENGKICGMIDYFDILNVFSNANFEIKNPPIMRDAMNKDVNLIGADSKLSEFKKMLFEKGADYAVVTKENKVVGIVTVKDLINSVRSGLEFDKFNVESIMSTHMVSMEPGEYIYEAFKVALERRYNQIPVMKNDKVMGVVTMRSLVGSYYDMISFIENSGS